MVAAAEGEDGFPEVALRDCGAEGADTGAAAWVLAVSLVPLDFLDFFVAVCCSVVLVVLVVAPEFELSAVLDFLDFFVVC